MTAGDGAEPHVVRYAPGPGDERGYVYLPGRGHPWYRQNVSVIFRRGLDGHWFRASDAWDRLMKRALAR